MEERCEHRMIRSQCYHCLQKEKAAKLRPAARQDKTVHGASAVPQQEVHEEGFVSIRVLRGHSSHDSLDENTRVVHINGHLCIWLLELILERAPNLKTVQVIPTELRYAIKDSHRELCRQRGVELVAGHVRPEFAWEPGEQRPTKAYLAEQTFMETLAGEQLTLFQELRAFGFDAAEMTALHYRLDDGEFLSEHKIAEKFGLKNNHNVSAYVHAILHYLDSNFSVKARSEQMAENVKRRVVRLREYFRDAQAQREFAERLGLPHLPHHFRPARFEILEGIIEARNAGRLARLQTQMPQHYQALTLRFGLEGIVPSSYRTLQEVGDLMGLTRERIRQLEEIAFYTLGISDPDAEMTDAQVREAAKQEAQTAGLDITPIPKQGGQTTPRKRVPASSGNGDAPSAPPVEIQMTGTVLEECNNVLGAVAGYYGVSAHTLLGTSNKQERFLNARYMVIYLLREVKQFDWEVVTKFMTQSRQTIDHAHREIQRRLERGHNATKNDVQRLKSRLV